MALEEEMMRMRTGSAKEEGAGEWSLPGAFSKALTPLLTAGPARASPKFNTQPGTLMQPAQADGHGHSNSARLNGCLMPSPAPETCRNTQTHTHTHTLCGEAGGAWVSIEKLLGAWHDGTHL